MKAHDFYTCYIIPVWSDQLLSCHGSVYIVHCFCMNKSVMLTNQYASRNCCSDPDRHAETISFQSRRRDTTMPWRPQEPWRLVKPSNSNSQALNWNYATEACRHIPAYVVCIPRNDRPASWDRGNKKGEHVQTWLRRNALQ